MRYPATAKTATLSLILLLLGGRLQVNADEEDPVLRAQGAMRVGKDNAIVPDASSDHPLIVSNPEDQPLCEPNAIIEPSQPLQVMEGYDAFVLTNVQGPRKVVVDAANHALVTSSEGLVSIRMDKCGNVEKTTLLSDLGDDGAVAYGVTLYDGNLYVASPNSVWRFNYVDGQHSPLSDGFQVLRNLHGTGNEDIAIDPFGHAYFPRHATDVNDDHSSSKQAIIKRFNFRRVPSDGYDFEEDGETFAHGTNVHGAMAFDAQARLWGLDSPYPSFEREDLGGALAPNGVAEEMNLYEFPYKNYGYPYCFTEYDLQPYTAASKGKGAQWGHPSQMNDTMDLDDYCSQDENNRRPAVPLTPNSGAHAMFFFMGTFCSVGDKQTLGTSVGMPCNWTDTPIVAYRGYPGQAEGHRVTHIPFDDLGHVPQWDRPEDLIFKAANDCQEGSACLTPTGLDVDEFGRLIIASEETNEIFMIKRQYNQNAAKLMTAKMDAKEEMEERLEELKEEKLEAQAEGLDVDDDDEEEEEEEEMDLDPESKQQIDNNDAPAMLDTKKSKNKISIIDN